MGIKTVLTEKLGIEFPVIQGGMQYVGYAEMAAAVSNAGGLGIITGLTQPDPESLRKEIRRCRTLTSKPFGVNLTILKALIPADHDAFMTVICEEKVNLVEISGGSPKKYLKQLKDAGVLVLHKSATLKHALKAQAVGVDFVEIAGFESSIAGRTGDDDVGTWVLMAKALEKLSVPVIVSGATGTGRQLAAALAMGAQGVTMGTRFLATQECPIKPQIKDFIADPKNDEFSTTLVLKTFNSSTRVFKNDVAKAILKHEAEGSGDFSRIAPLAKGLRAKDMFLDNGDANDAMWSCGQSIGLIEDIPTCRELLVRLVSQAESCLSAAAGKISLTSSL
mmetsp:Transcript_33887/g.66692  ORF Transcript_33887/g.66692 Transcript_33887/m.66692 type:complete len:335 (+) Transcript_33887:27-1031(+)